MSSSHRRPPTKEEQDILTLVHAVPQGVALMPIFFNGQERFGLVLVRQNAAGQYVQLLAVLPTVGDQILNGEGKPGSFTPPVAQNTLN
jgi:hypothetical protein